MPLTSDFDELNAKLLTLSFSGCQWDFTDSQSV